MVYVYIISYKMTDKFAHTKSFLYRIKYVQALFGMAQYVVHCIISTIASKFLKPCKAKESEVKLGE